MINFDKYFKECSENAEIAYEMINSDTGKLSRMEGFRLRYLCYLKWGVPFNDLFNKEYRVAKYLAKVLKISHEYTDDYSNFGWDSSSVIRCLGSIRRASRMLGYFGRFKVSKSGRRIRVYIDDVVYSIKDASHAIETMYDIAGYLARRFVDEELSDFVGTFMLREYNWMNILSFG